MNKILIIGPAHPYRGGIAKTNEILASELQKKGHQCRIETFRVQYPSFLFPGKTQYSEDSAPEKIIIKRSLHSYNPFNWLKVGYRLKKEKADLIIIRYWLPFMAPLFGTIARIVKKNNHTKIIGLTDNVIPHEKRPGDRMLTKYFTKNADAFLSLSKSVLDDINLFQPKKPKIYSPHPIFNTYGKIISKKEAQKNLGLTEEDKHILFFGLIREYKGLDLLLKSIALLKERIELKLIVAGEFYSDKQLYVKLINELGIENQVIIKDEFIPDQQVANYFCAADLVAQPYKSATQSGVTQVGFHFEKPMLVTNVGGLSEIIHHGKFGYVTELNPEDIANCIEDYYQNNRETSFKEAIKMEKEKYSWENMVLAIENLYNSLK